MVGAGHATKARNQLPRCEPDRTLPGCFFAVDHSEHPEHRKLRFARIRRAKWLLRFAPRRARFHHYPLIGRFAAVARKRAYLWSFKTEYVRPALYAGSIIAMLPIMGIQVPVAFCAALLLRGNVMVLAGLQFITNPLTALPLYYGTYQLGQAVIAASGFGSSVEVAPADLDSLATVTVPHVETLATTPPPELAWTQGLGTAFNSWVIGGVIAGAVLGLVLDLLWQFGLRRAAVHKAKVAARHHHSDSTPPITPPQ